jgi:hypothetical protein
VNGKKHENLERKIRLFSTAKRIPEDDGGGGEQR